jgi:hypothetical protein
MHPSLCVLETLNPEPQHLTEITANDPFVAHCLVTRVFERSWSSIPVPVLESLAPRRSGLRACYSSCDYCYLWHMLWGIQSC